MFISLLYCFANLNIEIISPCSGSNDLSLWNKVEKLVGKKCDNKNIKSSNEQVFEDANKKFIVLDKQLKSNTNILWSFRGGYGIDKIMPFIVKNDYSKVKSKIIVGYSDLTALQIYFSQKYNWKSISGCMLKDYFDDNKDNKSKEAIYSYLSNKILYLKLSKLKALNNAAKNITIIKGITTGGNSTSIQNGIGTDWQIDTNNKILFLEDVNVNGYQLDRILNHFNNAGLFNKVKAIIFGNFGNNQQNMKVLQHFANNINVPVFQTNEFGHQKENLPIGINFNGIIKKTGEYYSITMN